MSGVKAHVKVGVRALLANPFFGLFDEMGGMKSAQTIIAAQFLYDRSIIDRVIVVAPASVKSVWFDPELGELAKHLWFERPALISEYHSRIKQWDWQEKREPRLRWIVTNYEFIRNEERLIPLMKYTGPKTFLVLDESSAVKSHRAQQMQACLQLRRKCGRVVILNGTPIANTPMDMYSQGEILSPSILQVKSFFHYRARYAVMGGWQARQIIEYQHLDDLQNRFKPYVLRRLKKDCLSDLPAVLPPVVMEVALTQPTWKIYKAMRDEMVAWLSTTTVSVAQQAIVKSMRLAQICSGFLGGVVEELEDITDEGQEIKSNVAEVQEVGREKLDFILNWHKEQLAIDPNLKLLTWSRFIPELARYLREVKSHFPNHKIGCVAGKALLGKSKTEERNEAMRLLDPRTAPSGPVTVGGTLGTGSLGHNFTASHVMVSMSNDYALWKKDQGIARLDRPGQTQPVSTFDLAAVGPNGQKTVDHLILKVMRGKADVAKFTTQAWIHALMEE
jgi:SNF2-related domain